MIKVIELFAGIRSQTQALKNIGVEHEVIGISEIDKYAVKSSEAIHGEVNNFGDITKIEKLPQADLWTYSFPCQDISVAGRQEGIKEGTRSGLLYEVERLLEISEKPKYLLLENVKNLVGKAHKEDFDKWLLRLEEMGYKNYWQVLNAKNYGIPQNRERVFVVSIRKDLSKGFDFPIAFTEGEIITYNLQKQVRKRKNTCDTEELKKLLKTSKEKIGITINKITELIGEKKTLVEHWFRSDNCFSIPESENWFKLKEILNIQTNKFDSFITEFEVLDGVYEKANRIYGLEGICPTLTTVGVPEIVEYSFPEPFDNGLRLKDMLESEVDEKYYLKETVNFNIKNQDICYCIDANYHKGTNVKQFQEKAIRQIIQVGMLDIKGNEQVRRVYSDEGLSPTLNTMQGGNRQPKIVAMRGRYNENGIVEQQLEPRKDECTNTLTTVQKDNLLLSNFRIRKLTPKECWRLMGFKDEQFEKAKASGVSDSQLYKQAGNSIVVDVLEAIFKNLFFN